MGTKDRAKELLDAYAQASESGRFFSVVFVNRYGSIRRIVCRDGVKKGVKGVGMSYNPSDYNLKVVWDVIKRGFRMIPTDPSRVFSVVGRGKTLFKW